MRVEVYACVYMCEGQRRALDLLFDGLPTRILRQDVLLNPNFTDSGIQMREVAYKPQVSSYLHLPALGLQEGVARTGYPKSGIHACI